MPPSDPSPSLCVICHRYEQTADTALCRFCQRQAELAIGMGYRREVVAQMFQTGEIDVIVGVAGGRPPARAIRAFLQFPRETR